MPELKKSDLYKAFQNLRRQTSTIIANPGLVQTLTNRSGAGLGGLFKTPQGRVLAQAEMAIDMFKKLGKTWPQISNLFADGDFTQQDRENLQKIINQSLRGGILSQIKNAFKVNPFPGLGPSDVIRVVTDVAAQDENMQQDQQSQVQQQASRSSATTATMGTMGAQESSGLPIVPTLSEGVKTRTLKEDVADLQMFFQNLNTAFKPQSSFVSQALGKGTRQTQQQQKQPITQGQATGAGTASTAGSGTTNRPSQTKTTTPNQPAPNQPTTGSGAQATSGPSAPAIPAQQGQFSELKPNASDDQLQAITRVTGVEPDRLRKLVQTRGIRISVDPQYLQVK